MAISFPWLPASAWLGAVLLAASVASCGGGGAAAPGTNPSTGEPQAGSGAGTGSDANGGTGPGIGDGGGRSEPALAASQPGELLAFFQRTLAQRTPGMDAGTGAVFSAGAPTTTASPSLGFAGTTVQEAGVDEDDLLKTDGTLFFSLVRGTAASTDLVPPSRVLAHRREADGRLSTLADVTVANDAFFNGLYLSPDSRRLVLLGQREQVSVAYTTIAPLPPAQVRLQVLDVHDAALPALAQRIAIDGNLVATRLVGNLLYVVSQLTPSLAADRLPAGSAERDNAIRRLTTAELLPGIAFGDAKPQPLVADTDCYVQPANASLALQLTTITVFDLASPTLARSSRCFIGGSEAVYLTPTSLYIASTRYRYGPDGGRGIVYSAQTSTDLHKFALDGTRIQYRASGSVPGHLGWQLDKKAYRLSEHDDHLRVLSFTGETGWTFAGGTVTTSQPPSPATLSVLREQAGELRTVSTLPNARQPAPLGKPGEQVFAVRFAGLQAYVVTFRRTDPLYLLDLSEPTAPRVTGELQTTGYSDYLYPLGDGLLLGVGQDANEAGITAGLKLALFDVADPVRPRVIDSRVWGRRGSTSALDTSAHGINLFRQGGVTRVALPMRIHDGQSSGIVATPLAQGLARLEVDHASRTLAERPFVPSLDFTTAVQRQQIYGFYDVGRERAVQAGADAYYLTGGQLLRTPW